MRSYGGYLHRATAYQPAAPAPNPEHAKIHNDAQQLVKDISSKKWGKKIGFLLSCTVFGAIIGTPLYLWAAYKKNNLIDKAAILVRTIESDPSKHGPLGKTAERLRSTIHDSLHGFGSGLTARIYRDESNIYGDADAKIASARGRTALTFEHPSHHSTGRPLDSHHIHVDVYDIPNFNLSQPELRGLNRSLTRAFGDTYKLAQKVAEQLRSLGRHIDARSFLNEATQIRLSITDKQPDALLKFTQFSQKIGKTISEGGDRFASAVQGELQRAMDGALEVSQEAQRTAGKVGAELATSLEDASRGVVSTINSTIGEIQRAAPSVADSLSGVMSRTTDILGSAHDTMHGVVRTVEGVFADIPESEIFDGLGDFFDGTSEGTSAFSERSSGERGTSGLSVRSSGGGGG